MNGANKHIIRTVLMTCLGGLLICSMGCKALLPKEDKRTQNKWQSFHDAQKAFDQIAPHKTTLEDLHAMGFDYSKTPNLKILTYLEIIDRFIPNASIALEDLDPDVRDCIEAKDACQAYELELGQQKKDRFGNVPLDVFGFKKNTHVTGWNFRALVLIKDDLVIYKLRSGVPNIDRVEKKTKPLGPFQEMDGVVSKAIRAF